MLKRIPLRLRLTLLSILLLAACCVGLTIVLNLSAYHMADAIEAIPMMPSIPLTPSIKPPPAAETSASHLSEKSQRARSTFSYQSILYMLFVVAIGGGLTYNLSGKALQPLRELSHQMHHRTVHNLSQALPVPKSHDEIADLTRAFNEMSRKLGDVFAMQKRFSQSAAHELRTPLAVLQTKVEVFAKKKEHTAVEYDQLLSVITTHTHRLTNLVKDLLDLTNMDALACDETIALKALLAEVTAALSEPAKEKNVSLTLVGEEQMIRGNRTLLHHAFYNLVENAMKYNVEGGSVQIDLSTAGARSVVTVSDTGIGIPDDMRALVFEPFFRVDPSRTRKMGGTGLGLSIVASILEKHHGQIAILDRLGGGVAFQITL